MKFIRMFQVLAKGIHFALMFEVITNYEARHLVFLGNVKYKHSRTWWRKKSNEEVAELYYQEPFELQ